MHPKGPRDFYRREKDTEFDYSVLITVRFDLLCSQISIIKKLQLVIYENIHVCTDRDKGTIRRKNDKVLAGTHCVCRFSKIIKPPILSYVDRVHFVNTTEDGPLYVEHS